MNADQIDELTRRAVLAAATTLTAPQGVTVNQPCRPPRKDGEV